MEAKMCAKSHVTMKTGCKGPLANIRQQLFTQALGMTVRIHVYPYDCDN
jgi:hypothetical protein